MAMTINTNIQSLNAQRNLSTSQSSLATSMQRLSSGMRINSAKDDSAGLAIAERMSAQVRGLNQAARNANDGVSLAQTAEGALSTVGNNLQRIRELAVQSRNATNSSDDRQALNTEVQQLKAEIQRVAENTSFNDTKLINGDFTNKAFQVGANQGQTIDIAQIVDARTNKLGSWTSADTASKFTGSAPVGATTGGTTANGTAALDVSSLVDGTGNWSAVSIQIGGGSAITVAAETGGGKTADDLAAAIATAIGTSAPGITASAGTGADSGKVLFTNTNATSSTVTGSIAGTIGAATTTGGTTTFDPGTFSLTGSKGAVTISFDKAASASDRASALVKAINNQSSATGVTAFLDDGKLALQSASGDITIAAGSGAGDATGLAKATGLAIGTTAGAALAGSTAHVAGTAKTGFDSIDITSIEGADNAILAMDAALKTVNSARADLGAIQNRFTSVVENLGVNSENLSASRSRIMDADFASETANLSRSQILQQAGTAMVAQANQLPQGVLSLLR